MVKNKYYTIFTKIDYFFAYSIVGIVELYLTYTYPIHFKVI